MNDTFSDDILLLKQHLAEQEALIHALQEKLAGWETGAANCCHGASYCQLNSPRSSIRPSVYAYHQGRSKFYLVGGQ